jgi:uncharacterized protein YigE (DUF2233 family)
MTEPFSEAKTSARDSDYWKAVRPPIVFALVLLAVSSQPATALPACAKQTFEGSEFVACTFEVRKSRLALFYADQNNLPYGEFSAVAQDLATRDLRLRFAMNAGMYHDDRSPVGLLVVEGKQRAAINVANAGGNFFLKPNGIFYFDAQRAGILETSAFQKTRPTVRNATQSGPMLVINGQIHPKFGPASTSYNRRNGVGVSSDGSLATFAIADDLVNFHKFARFFRDRLGTPNALYLDGAISRLYAPESGRDDLGVRMGPIVGVIEERNVISNAQGQK